MHSGTYSRHCAVRDKPKAAYIVLKHLERKITPKAHISENLKFDVLHKTSVFFF
jgi:hypothetical protein